MRLRRILILGAFATAAGAAGSAAAQDAAPRQFAVVGSAPQVCALQQGLIRTGRLINFAGTDGNVLRVQQFVDPATLAVRAASAQLTFAAVCNFAHQLRVESQHNGLWPTDGRVGPTGRGFASAVPYDATVRWADQTDRLEVDARVNRIVERSVAVNAPYAGDLVLDINILEGASNVELRAPVIAGDYADTLRIYLEPR